MNIGLTFTRWTERTESLNYSKTTGCLSSPGKVMMCQCCSYKIIEPFEITMYVYSELRGVVESNSIINGCYVWMWSRGSMSRLTYSLED